jgi:sulfatase modifying factor 1
MDMPFALHIGSLRRLARDYVVIGIAAMTFGAAIGWAARAWKQRTAAAATPRAVEGDGIHGPRGMMWIPGGEFVMGGDSLLAKANERPAHKVRVHGFWMDRAPVTNAQFAAFVAATSYVSTAERPPSWETLTAQLPAGSPKPPDDALVPGGMVFVGTERPVNLNDYTQWWQYVPGANWRHPEGPGSSIGDKDDYPVVQVSYDDALTYARWAGKRLPTEAEWEFAARGGLNQATYTWGNEFAPGRHKMANVWEGSAQPFPVIEPHSQTRLGRSQVCTFPRNGYGLCDMAGNVWQWVADWYRADAFKIEAQRPEPVDPQGPSDSYDTDDPSTPTNAPKRVTRGGSFLCNQSYCMSYRVSARQGSDPDTSTSHIGIRLVSGHAVPDGSVSPPTNANPPR